MTVASAGLARIGDGRAAAAGCALVRAGRRFRQIRESSCRRSNGQRLVGRWEVKLARLLASLELFGAQRHPSTYLIAYESLVL